MRFLSLPVTPEANADIKAVAEKRFWVQTAFEVVFRIYPVDYAVHRTILDVTHTTRGALKTMARTGDYSQFERRRDFIDSLAVAFQTPTGIPIF